MAEYFKTFLKTANHLLKIESDEHAIKAISFVKELEEPSDIQPEILLKAQKELQKYFDGDLKEFSLELEPEGTDFQKKYGLCYTKFLLEKLGLTPKWPIS